MVENGLAQESEVLGVLEILGDVLVGENFWSKGFGQVIKQTQSSLNGANAQNMGKVEKILLE